MKTHYIKFAIIIALALLFAQQIFPASEKLKLGKDLAGGVTLTYGIKPNERTGAQPTPAEINQIIAVIRDRLDPRGLFDISIEAQGGNQLEIGMPLPSADVKEARAAFERHVTEMARASMDEATLDQTLRLPPDQRAAAVANLIDAVPEREEPLNRAIELYDRIQRLEADYAPLAQEAQEATAQWNAKVEAALEAENAALNAAEEAGVNAIAITTITGLEEPEALQSKIDELVTDAPDAQAARTAIADYLEAKAAHLAVKEEAARAKVQWRLRLDPLESEIVDYEQELRSARQEVLNLSIDAEEVRRVLALDQAGRPSEDPRTGEAILLPSPRETGMERLLDQFPAMADEIKEAARLWDDYKGRSRGYDDPKDLIALLRGAGVLNFRIAAQPGDALPIDELRRELRERGPSSARASDTARWFEVDNPDNWPTNEAQREYMYGNPTGYFASNWNLVVEEFDGAYYMLLYTQPDKALSEASGPWKLVQASRQVDRKGRPSVNFRLDVEGARLFGQLTSNNIGSPMAIVLDDQVYSAPTIQSRISDSGEITGNYTSDDIDYLLRVLNAGSLQAQLTELPIAQNTIGPRLGLDNLRRGLEAGMLSFIVIGVFMIVYYFAAGAVADVALAINGLFILGMMAMTQAAFTMPGIAGIVLTFGMAVDANVLIYERIREEIEAGSDIKTAIRLGYERAMSSIVDGNITNLIVCFVLGFTASPDVKGFAITLGIGVVSTLFSALFVTRAIFEAGLALGLVRRLSMLPTVWRSLSRALHPSFDWVAMRHFWQIFSVIAVVLGLSLTAMTWREMLDTEFLGGTSVTISFRDDPTTGEPITLERAEVEKRLKDYATDAFEAGDISDEAQRALLGVNVFNLNADEVEGAGFASSAFILKTTLSDQDAVEDAIVSSFEGLLNIPPIVSFTGSDVDDVLDAPVYAVTTDTLGESIGDRRVLNDVRPFMGGVAIVLSDLSPAMSLDDIRFRLDQSRRSPEFENLIGRKVEVIGVTRDGNATNSEGEALFSDVVIVVDGQVSGVSWYDDVDLWRSLVAEREWNLIRTGLTEPPTLDQITTVSPTVAEQLRATAVVSITLSLLGILAYIWVRFGSFRYSAAAVLALVHDVCVTLGLLSLTHYVFNTTLGRVLYIEPFKIDMGVIAALLTIIGYSLNDSIIVMDRIRENRGKLLLASKDVVNRSINATISRTLLTSGTTLLALLIMYIEGGTGIRPFAFAMLCGIMVGTYSSIGVAAPMVLSRRAEKPRPAVD